MTRLVYLALDIGIRLGSTLGRRGRLLVGRGGPTSDSVNPADSRGQLPGDGHSLSYQSGDRFVLARPEGYHAATVKRTSPGEEIDAVGERGDRARCAIVGVSKREVELGVLGPERGLDSSPRVTFLQASAKGSWDDQTVGTATEYRIWHAVPWANARAVANWRGKEEKAQRCQELIVLAAFK